MLCTYKTKVQYTNDKLSIWSEIQALGDADNAWDLHVCMTGMSVSVSYNAS